MNSKLIKSEKEIVYPCLMQNPCNSKNAIILMTAPGCGIIVFCSFHYELGMYRNDWSKTTFVPISPDIKIILSN